jgi:hypothetical protein
MQVLVFVFVTKAVPKGSSSKGFLHDPKQFFLRRIFDKELIEFSQGLFYIASKGYARLKELYLFCILYLLVYGYYHFK